MVLAGAAVAQLDPPPALGRDLGHGALNVGAVAAVVFAQVRVGCPVRPGGAQQVIAFVQVHAAPGGRGGAPGAQGAVPAQHPEGHRRARGDRPALPGPAGQVTVRACSSTVKSSTVNPAGTAGVTGLGLITASSPARSITPRSSPVP